MSAIDTAKDFISIVRTAGLSREIIDMLEKKKALLTEEVLALQSKVVSLSDEISHLKLENAQLRQQLENFQPITDRIRKEKMAVLKVLATRQGYWTPQEVAGVCGLDDGRVHSLLAQLVIEKLSLPSAHDTFQISNKGQAELLKA